MDEKTKGVFYRPCARVDEPGHLSRDGSTSCETCSRNNFGHPLIELTCGNERPVRRNRAYLSQVCRDEHGVLDAARLAERSRSWFGDAGCRSFDAAAVLADAFPASVVVTDAAETTREYRLGDVRARVDLHPDGCTMCTSPSTKQSKAIGIRRSDDPRAFVTVHESCYRHRSTDDAGVNHGDLPVRDQFARFFRERQLATVGDLFRAVVRREWPEPDAAVGGRAEAVRDAFRALDGRAEPNADAERSMCTRSMAWAATFAELGRLLSDNRWPTEEILDDVFPVLRRLADEAIAAKPESSRAVIVDADARAPVVAAETPACDVVLAPDVWPSRMCSLCRLLDRKDDPLLQFKTAASPNTRTFHRSCLSLFDERHGRAHLVQRFHAMCVNDLGATFNAGGAASLLERHLPSGTFFRQPVVHARLAAHHSPRRVRKHDLMRVADVRDSKRCDVCSQCGPLCGDLDVIYTPGSKEKLVAHRACLLSSCAARAGGEPLPALFLHRCLNAVDDKCTLEDAASFLAELSREPRDPNES